MTLTLAIDPGVSTGYAVLQPDGSIVQTGCLAEDEIDSLGALEGISHVVVELMPVPTMSRMNQQLRRVINIIDQIFPTAVKVTPGVWKTSAAIRMEVPKLPTPHEKDAVRLGWYLQMRMKKEADNA